MNLKTILIAAVVAFIGIQAFRFQRRGTKLATTETALADTSAALSDLRLVNKGLKENNGWLSGQLDKKDVTIADLGRDNANLKAANDRADASAYKAQLAQREKDRLLIEANNKLTRVQKEALLKRVQQGSIGTDSLSTILNLQAQLTDRDSVVIPDLNKQLSKATDRISDLEIQANNDQKAMIQAQSEISRQNNAVADRIEAVPQGVLNINYGKRIRRAVNEIRAGRVRK